MMSRNKFLTCVVVCIIGVAIADHDLTLPASDNLRAQDTEQAVEQLNMSPEASAIDGDGHWFDLRRLIGSNCIMVGNGVLPPFFRCNGCIVDLATACVNDFKANASGNVDPACDLNVMKETPQTECCPQYDLSRRKPRVLYKSAAYPHALQCIKSVGCELSQVYTDLIDNCLSSCSTVYPDLDAHSVCTNTFSGSTSLYRTTTLPFLFAVALLFLHHCIL